MKKKNKKEESVMLDYNAKEGRTWAIHTGNGFRITGWLTESEAIRWITQKFVEASREYNNCSVGTYGLAYIDNDGELMAYHAYAS